MLLCLRKLGAVCYLDQVRSYGRDEGRVVLHHGGEADGQFGLTETGAFEHQVRLFAPGNKEAVVFHACHHVIDLLHGVPAGQGSVNQRSATGRR